MIERIKLSAAAKQQLITLKRRTGIEHYNVLCRHALMLSLSDGSPPPREAISFAGGIEIDWKVFCGEAFDVYFNLLATRSIKDHGSSIEDVVRMTLTAHLHRGLSRMTAAQAALV